MSSSRRIRICFPGLAGEALFDQSARDNSAEPFIYLRERLRSLGFELESSDDEDLSGVHALWFWDVTGAIGKPGPVERALRRVARRDKEPLVVPSPLLRRALRGTLRDRLVLFLFEPPAVQAANWNPHLHRWFHRIFTWHNPLVDGERYVKFLCPIPLSYPPVADPPFERRKLLVNISANKLSSHDGELYSVRARSIRFFETAAGTEFDLFGFGWDLGDAAGHTYPSYRGRVANKWEVLPNYRFALCYENQQMQGWVTEKIFDCLRCGVIPVYLGDPEIKTVVARSCFIDRRSFGDDRALLSFLRAMSPETFLGYRQAITKYLASPAFRMFTSPVFADTIVRTLGLAQNSHAEPGG